VHVKGDLFRQKYTHCEETHTSYSWVSQTFPLGLSLFPFPRDVGKVAFLPLCEGMLSLNDLTRSTQNSLFPPRCGLDGHFGGQTLRAREKRKGPALGTFFSPSAAEKKGENKREPEGETYVSSRSRSPPDAH